MLSARRPLLAACAAAAGLAGCGNDRATPPDVTTATTPSGSRLERDAASGLSFRVPDGWSVRRGKPPLVATMTSGRASIALFRYGRTEPLPRDRAELDAAARALGRAALQRDPSFQQIARDRARVDGRAAVVLRGNESVAGQRRSVRSTHVYGFDGEVVVDAIAPPEAFARVDAAVFRPVVASVRLSEPRS